MEATKCDCCGKETRTPIKGNNGYYCSDKCVQADNDEKALGCIAGELQVGMEFSCDEGRKWYVVRTEPKYVSEEPECTMLRFMAAPGETTSLSAWEEFRLDDHDHILFQREWKG